MADIEVSIMIFGLVCVVILVIEMLCDHRNLWVHMDLLGLLVAGLLTFFFLYNC